MTMPEPLIQEQLVQRGIRDSKVLEAMRTIPRETFVRPEDTAWAYADRALDLDHGQTISQPYIVAYMTELLRLKPTHRVLEIGTGSGYQTAMLASLVHEVFSIEIIPELHSRAKDRLKTLGFQNIALRLGNGYKGWPAQAPFDRILLTAAPETIPGALIEQLGDEGVIAAPVGRAHETQHVMLGEKRHGIVQFAEKISVRFVPMVKAKGTAA